MKELLKEIIKIKKLQELRRNFNLMINGDKAKLKEYKKLKNYLLLGYFKLINFWAISNLKRLETLLLSLLNFS